MGKRCCNKVFPTFAVIVLILAILWILAGFNIIRVDIPWIPIIIAVIAVGWIINYYIKNTKKK
jgi:hypothetical protein